jgi:hypothetical protein
VEGAHLVGGLLFDVTSLAPLQLARGGIGMMGFKTVLVSESIPLVNTAQRASIGERTPGFNQVSSLVKRRDVSDDEFRDIWLHDQKLIAIECQSSFGYKRNSIVRPMTAGARNYLGIVEENFPIEALTDPRVFYDANSDAQLRERVDRMTRNVERFLQMDEVELTPMSEYLLG